MRAGALEVNVGTQGTQPWKAQLLTQASVRQPIDWSCFNVSVLVLSPPLTSDFTSTSQLHLIISFIYLLGLSDPDSLSRDRRSLCYSIEYHTDSNHYSRICRVDLHSLSLVTYRSSRLYPEATH